jgi:hypothetical protein
MIQFRALKPLHAWEYACCVNVHKAGDDVDFNGPRSYVSYEPIITSSKSVQSTIVAA